MNAEILHQKFEQFGALYAELKKRAESLEVLNDDLKKEISKLRKENGSSKPTSDDFQNQTKIGKIVNELESVGGNQPELKSLLDQYISEINNCIEKLKVQ